MALASSNKSRILFNRTTPILFGLLILLLVIMNLSPGSDNSNKIKDNSLPLSLQQDLIFKLAQQEAEERTEPNFPAELTSSQSEKDDYSKALQGSSSTTEGPRPKKILIWNKYWKSTALWHKIFHEIVFKQCPQSNCKITLDRSNLDQSDAVLFHLVDIPAENYTFPENRDPTQIWIGMTYEPPYILQKVGIDLKRLNSMFNRTMSYRTDGDIVVRHGTFFRISDSIRHNFPAYASSWVNSHESIEERNYAEGKRRLVAWFASSRNCESQSGREKYVKELQNFMQVDVYGSCGPYKCGVQKTMRNPYKVEEDDCYMLISVGYKFVLAFENSLCEDYVTEKLYNHLKLNVVPVVFGASNYSIFAPPNAVIDASQYTPEELSKYLQMLDKNDTLYNQYFRWKKDYLIEAHDGVPLACDLCEQLHNPNWQVERKVYEQFDKWIVSGCRKGYGES